MDRRRGLRCAVGIIVGAAASPAFEVLGQPRGRVWRVGILSFGSQARTAVGRYEAFFRGLREHGYSEGDNLIVETRYANGDAQRLHDLVAELLRLKVDVILATSTITCQAAQQQTHSVPIVVAATADPVGDGFALSLARPGKNITGMSTIATEAIQKNVELLRLLEPRPRNIAVLTNPLDRAHAPQLERARGAGRAMGIEIAAVSATNAGEFGAAFAAAADRRADAMLVLNDGLFFAEREALAAAGLKQRLPMMFGFRDGAETGMLMSYGPSLTALFHRSASFVARILRGAAPGDLPFEQPTTFELVLNRQTARAIGATLPQALLMRADEVIE